MNKCKRALSGMDLDNNCNGGCFWMSTKEAASYLKTTPNNLRNEVYLGRVPVFKHGRKNIFLSCELDLMIVRSRDGSK